MKTERVLLSILAVFIGLLVAGVVFFLYENTKNTPQKNTKTVSSPIPTPTPKPSIFLIVDQPTDEEVVSKKIISISGKTAFDAVVTVLTGSDEQVLTPTSSGDFSTTTTIEDGYNLIKIIAIDSRGESISVSKIVTFSAEEF